MEKQEVIKHFGGVIATAKALGVSHVAVSRWGKEIPQGRAYQIEVITKGKLKVNKQNEVKREKIK